MSSAWNAILILIAIFVPIIGAPLAVFFKHGINYQFWITLVLDLLWFPAVIYAICVILLDRGGYHYIPHTFAQQNQVNPANQPAANQPVNVARDQPAPNQATTQSMSQPANQGRVNEAYPYTY